MGYELHITRADEWFDSEDAPITLDEWKAYVASDPELVMTGVAEATTPRGEVIRMEDEGLAQWRSLDRRERWFHHHEGRISVKHPDDVTLAKMRQIARALGAHLQDDDGELYDDDQT